MSRIGTMEKRGTDFYYQNSLLLITIRTPPKMAIGLIIYCKALFLIEHVLHFNNIFCDGIKFPNDFHISRLEYGSTCL